MSPYMPCPRVPVPLFDTAEMGLTKELIDQRETIRKLTFRALPLRQTELGDYGLFIYRLKTLFSCFTLLSFWKKPSLAIITLKSVLWGN